MSKAPRPWYETFFGPDYLKLYVHTTTAEEVDAIVKILGLRRGARVLDVACGAGRHAIELARREYEVTGIDFSETLLAEARRAARKARARVAFVHADMRELSFAGTFDAAINMFTSFGYFDRPSEDRRVLAGIARALKPRGKFLLEMFNRDSLVGNLPDQAWRVREGGSVILQEDLFDALTGRYETRQIVIDAKGTREHRGSVRAYTLAELKELVEAERLYVHRVLGGLDLSPYTPRSGRIVLYAVKGITPETIRTMW